MGLEGPRALDSLLAYGASRLGRQAILLASLSAFGQVRPMLAARPCGSELLGPRAPSAESQP